MTLEQILEKEKQRRCEGGQFGIKACKDSIRWYADNGENLYMLLGEYVERANKDILFNRAMILACWELINEED